MRGVTTITAAFKLGGEEPLQCWAVAALGASSLVFAALGHTTGPLDLATVAGVVLFGGIAGEGWRPRARKALLAMGPGGSREDFRLDSGTYPLTVLSPPDPGMDNPSQYGVEHHPIGAAQTAGPTPP